MSIEDVRKSYRDDIGPELAQATSLKSSLLPESRGICDAFGLYRPEAMIVGVLYLEEDSKKWWSDLQLYCAA